MRLILDGHPDLYQDVCLEGFWQAVPIRHDLGQVDAVPDLESAGPAGTRPDCRLAAHGGVVSLVEIVEDNTAVLEFGGGCQGCAAVDITLKQGVETTLLEQVPDLAAIRDVTDHTVTANAYYQ